MSNKALREALEECIKDLIATQVNAHRAARYDHNWKGVVELIQPTIDQARKALKEDQVKAGLPYNCRERLRMEGRGYPKSGCGYCSAGSTVGCPFKQESGDE